MGTREGFWSVYYVHSLGAGTFGMIVLDGGTIIGADVMRGRWDGRYELNPETLQLDLDLHVSLPPQALYFATGQEHSIGWSQSFKVSISRDEEVVHQLQTMIGQLNVAFNKIRDFP